MAKIDDDGVMKPGGEAEHDIPSRPKEKWKLQVQNVTLEFDHPQVIVRDALERAKVDLSIEWNVILKLKGGEKKQLGLGDVVDLAGPGVEKLRVSPKEIGNGEAPPAPRRDFDLQSEDHAFLEQLGLRWETVSNGRRWLLLHAYRTPAGYTPEVVTLALEIQPTYPMAAIYGFYTYPALGRSDGQPIPSTQLSGVIDEQAFVGWSRYRTNPPWNPQVDNVRTHLALVEGSMAKEVEQ